MPTSYAEVLTLLEGSRTQLRDASRLLSDADPVDWLKQLRFAELRAADAACEEFALHQRWPEVGLESVAAQLHLRLTAAITLCRILSHKPLPEGADLRQLLRLMLLDYWHGKMEKLGCLPSGAPPPAEEPRNVLPLASNG